MRLKLSIKAILFLDNAPMYPRNIFFDDIKVMIL